MGIEYLENVTSPYPLSPSDVEGDDQNADRGWVVGGIENSALVRTIYGMIAFSGITANLFACFVFMRVPALRLRTSQFIINLSIIDTINSVIIIPFHLFPKTPPLPAGLAGEILCRFYISKFPVWECGVASVYGLVVVTLERYFAVVHPIRYKRYFAKRLTVPIAACCWVVPLLKTGMFFVLFDVVDGVCGYVPSPVGKKIYGIFTFSLVLALPTAVILFCHSRIVLALRRQAEALNTGQGRMGGRSDGPNQHGDGSNTSGPSRWQLKMAQDMNRTFLVVIVAFILCWSPNQFLFLAYSLGAPVDFSKTYYHISVICVLFNSSVNPFIYVFKNKTFRRGIPQAFGWKAARGAQVSSMAPTATGCDGNGGNPKTSSEGIPQSSIEENHPTTSSRASAPTAGP